jgi:hypothetical protein
MDGFKYYLERNEEQTDIDHTLAKLPERHRRFLQGFSISFQGTNTLNNDGQHVGVIQTHPKPHITIASPWNYGREYALLHEVGHLVYENLLDHNMRQIWAHIVAKTKNRQKQSAEELFCMAYANHYAKNKIVIHTHPEWEEFIAQLH